MANVKISDLPAATSLATTDIFPLVQSSLTKQAAFSLLPGLVPAIKVTDSPYDAAGDGITDDTTPIQDAINAAYIAGGGFVVLPIGTYIVTGLTLKSNVVLMGAGFSAILKLKANSSTHVISLATDATSWVVRDLQIDGNSANQTTASLDGLHLDNTGGTSGLLMRGRVFNVYSQSCKGSGFLLGFAVRSCLLQGCVSYSNDEYGIYINSGADSQVSDCDVGQSGLDGVRVNGSGAFLINSVKSWFSGRLTAGSAGFLIRNSNLITLNNCYSQENSGSGYSLFGQSSTLSGLILSGCIADGDNTQAASNYGCVINNVTASRIDINATKTTTTGTPVNGVNIAASAYDNEITVAGTGQSGTLVAGAGIGNNRVFLRGREIQFNNLDDDFLGPSLVSAWWTGHVGSNGGCVSAAINSQTGGAVRLTTGADAGGTMALNGSQMDSELNWAANQDGLVITVKLKISAITNVAVFVGFTDQNSALEMPIYGSGVGDGLTSDASDACGVLFDTAMTTQNWWLVGVKGNTDATAQNTAVAPVAATYETWRIVFSNSGSTATFYRNGSAIGTSMSNAVTASTRLTPVVAAFSRAGASRNIDVDRIRVASLFALT